MRFFEQGVDQEKMSFHLKGFQIPKTHLFLRARTNDAKVLLITKSDFARHKFDKTPKHHLQ